ncbi:MAG: GNAT family N-acetyltransferase [Clostridia bacterium]
MSSIRLRPVDRENWEECILLSVREDQKAFVASNVYSLAQARVQDECVPMAVYRDEHMVGFLMYAKDRVEEQYWVYRLMVDRRFQGQGIARQAMCALMCALAHRTDFEKLRISYEPDNRAAAHLYQSLGFKTTGEVIEGEVVAEWVPAQP